MPRDFKDEKTDTPTPAATEAAAQPPVDSASAAPKRRGKTLVLIMAALLAVSLAGWKGQEWWTAGRFMVETDDAYVHADFAVMAPKVSGYVAEVLVAQNAPVKAGDPLVRIEPGDYRNALEAADSRIAAQKAGIARAERQIDAVRAAVVQAKARKGATEAELVRSKADMVRYEALGSSDFVSRQRLESARATEANAEAAVTEATANIAASEANLTVAQAAKTEAEAALAELQAAREKATRDLGATTIRAPFDGVIGNRNVAVGDYVVPGQRLLAVVPLDGVYVDANFKETQINDLKPGTPVDIHVDAYPDRKVTGHITGFSPASGSVFSLLPAENATGNFTKVVQRVPVRVAIPAEITAQGWLRPGLSVVVTADTRGDATAAQE